MRQWRVLVILSVAFIQELIAYRGVANSAVLVLLVLRPVLVHCLLSSGKSTRKISSFYFKLSSTSGQSPSSRNEKNVQKSKGSRTMKMRSSSALKKSEGGSLVASESILDSQRIQKILRNRQSRGKPSVLITEDEKKGATVDPILTRKHVKNRSKIKATSETIQNNLPKDDNDKSFVKHTSRSKDDKKSNVSSRKTATESTIPTLKATPSNGINFPYEYTLLALQAFYNEHYHLVLPRRFLVPESSTYPSIWHGVDLAGTVYNMQWWQKHVKQRPDRVNELNKMGFVWERLQPEWNLILEALIVYRAINGNLLVPTNFVVPHGDNDWPKACWGIALGNAVYKIRNRGDHLRDAQTTWSRREQLDAIGFVWDVGEIRFKKFCSALQLYGEIEQKLEEYLHHQTTMPFSSFPRKVIALKIPTKFVVPRSSRWPNEFWGYPLGERCTQVRHQQLYVKGHPDRLKILAGMGFYFSGGNDNLKWLRVVHAAALYSQMHENTLDVPTKFVVPASPRRMSERNSESSAENDKKVAGSCGKGTDDAWPWPEHLWGFPLGQRLRDIRLKGYYLRGNNADARRRQLDALGFNWNPKRGRQPKST